MTHEDSKNDVSMTTTSAPQSSPDGTTPSTSGATTTTTSSSSSSGFGGFQMKLTAKKPTSTVTMTEHDSTGGNHGGGEGGAITATMITEFDGSEKTAEPKKSLVIPLIVKNDWRGSPSASGRATPVPPPAAESGGISAPAAPTLVSLVTSKELGDKTKEKNGSKAGEHPDDTQNQTAAAAAAPKEPLSLDEEAARAILRELLEAPEEKKGEDLMIPLMKMNQPPGLEDITDEKEKFKRDMEMRPEECTLEDYDAVPVEDFGAAMLRGMGWTEGKPIGKNQNGLAQPITYVARHDRLGLGAAPKPALDEPPPRRIPKQGEPVKKTDRKNLVAPTDASGRVRHVVTIDEQLVERETEEVKGGARVVVTHGRHKGLTGKVVSFIKDLVVIKLDLNGEEVKVERDDVENRVVYERKQADKARNKERDRERERERDRERDRDRDREMEKGRERDRDREKGKDREKDREKDDRPSKKSKPEERPWLAPSITVRIISQSFMGGKHYTKKASVVDVVFPKDGGEAECSIHLDGKLIDRVPQSSLETVVPKVGGRVFVLRGKHRNQSGEIVKRDTAAATASVRLSGGDDSIVTVSYDDMSEYVGEDD